jgi:hypothetical protein
MRPPPRRAKPRRTIHDDSRLPTQLVSRSKRICGSSVMPIADVSGFAFPAWQLTRSFRRRDRQVLGAGLNCSQLSCFALQRAAKQRLKPPRPPTLNNRLCLCRLVVQQRRKSSARSSGPCPDCPESGRKFKPSACRDSLISRPTHTTAFPLPGNVRRRLELLSALSCHGNSALVIPCAALTGAC